MEDSKKDFREKVIKISDFLSKKREISGATGERDIMKAIESLPEQDFDLYKRSVSIILKSLWETAISINNALFEIADILVDLSGSSPSKDEPGE